MVQTRTLVASTVMDQAAALMNDVAKSIYTYTIQIPYLNLALQALQEEFELNNVPVTDTVTSAAIEVPAGTEAIGFAPTPPVADTPYLPDDIIEPKVVWVSESGQNQYIPIGRVDFLPRYEEGVEVNLINEYVWQSQEIRFLAANEDNDVKLDYIRNLFQPVTLSTDSLGVINAASYLEFKTAAYLAVFIGENPTRGGQLDSEATEALYRSLGISSKGRQRINIRHRPFRANYKRRTYM